MTVHFTGDNPPPDARARRVIVAIGRTGDFRRLNVSGEELDKVSNRLIDPHEFEGKNVLVVAAGIRRWRRPSHWARRERTSR